MDTMTPERLRYEADWHLGHPCAGPMNAAASAWEADRKRLGALAALIRKSCHKHGGGDDACSCHWLERTLAPNDTSQANRKSPEGEEWPPKRLVIDGDNDPVVVPYENLCPECNRITNGRRCAHCAGE